jgi:hypothetical protein
MSSSWRFELTMAIRLAAKREARSERGLRIGRAVAQASTTGIGLVACEEDLDELIGYVAAEAQPPLHCHVGERGRLSWPPQQLHTEDIVTSDDHLGRGGSDKGDPP